MTDSHAPLPDISQWQVGQIELVAFPVDGIACMEQSWWADLVNSEPESIRKKLERIDSGEFQGSVLRLVVNPVRISWSLTPRVEINLADMSFSPPAIGNPVDVLEKFGNIMRRWLDESCPDITRLGLAMGMGHFAESVEATYKLLDAYLPSVKVDPSSKDFQYRINRPRPTQTGIPGLIINRISVWSSIKLAIQAELKSSPLPQAAAHTESAEHLACLVNLDINSSPEFVGTLPRNKVVDLWTEFAAMAIEIASKGDIP